MNPHKQGSRACTNRRAVPYDTITSAIVGHLDERLLDPRALRDLLTSEMESRRQDPDTLKARVAEVRGDLHRLDRELDNLTCAVTHGGDIHALVKCLKDIQARRDDTARLLTALVDMAQAPTLDVDAWMEGMKERLQDIRGYLESDTVN